MNALFSSSHECSRCRGLSVAAVRTDSSIPRAIRPSLEATSGGAERLRIMSPTRTAVSWRSVPESPVSAPSAGTSRSRRAAIARSRRSASGGKSLPIPPTSETPRARRSRRTSPGACSGRQSTTAFQTLCASSRTMRCSHWTLGTPSDCRFSTLGSYRTRVAAIPRPPTIRHAVMIVRTGCSSTKSRRPWAKWASSPPGRCRMIVFHRPVNASSATKVLSTATRQRMMPPAAIVPISAMPRKSVNEVAAKAAAVVTAPVTMPGPIRRNTREIAEGRSS